MGGVLSHVAEKTALKSKDVKAVVETLMGVAVGELKKNGSFKFAGMMNMKLKNKSLLRQRLSCTQNLHRSIIMAPMKAMKAAMKAKATKAMKAGAMSQSGALSAVAEKTSLKAKYVKAVVEALMGVAVGEL